MTSTTETTKQFRTEIKHPAGGWLWEGSWWTDSEIEAAKEHADHHERLGYGGRVVTAAGEVVYSTRD